MTAANQLLSTLKDDKFVKPPKWLLNPEPKSFRPKRKYRTIWISDIHLGTKGCNADLLVDFLHSVECETLYLVGDIVDGWRLRKGWYWPAAHNEVVRRLLKWHTGAPALSIFLAIMMKCSATMSVSALAG